MLRVVRVRLGHELHAVAAEFRRAHPRPRQQFLRRTRLRSVALSSGGKRTGFGRAPAITSTARLSQWGHEHSRVWSPLTPALADPLPRGQRVRTPT